MTPDPTITVELTHAQFFRMRSAMIAQIGRHCAQRGTLMPDSFFEELERNIEALLDTKNAIDSAYTKQTGVAFFTPARSL